MATAIEFNHVGKQYRLGLVSTKTLSHDLNRWWQMTVRGKEDPYLKIGETNDRTIAGDSEYVWALRDIDFKVEQGDVVGIIGKNGAGKSTLLKLLSKVTGPTVGTIRARGRIGALLEVGTGFHPEMTGRENIYMNGAIMGMTKNDIARKLDEIVAFSGCERYIDTPVKRYSSGMTVRLGFAVAAHLDPEILVVDEVLAVGDAEFQKKAIGKMQDVSRGEGRTVLFVSHNMASILALCKTGILLDNGRVLFQGAIGAVVNRYLNETNIPSSNLLLANRLDRKGNGKARFISADFFSQNGRNVPICVGDSVRFRFCLFSSESLCNIRMMFTIYNSYHLAVLDGNSFYEVQDSINLKEGKSYCEIHYDCLPLACGTYRMNLRLWDEEHNDVDWIENALSFEIIESDYYGTGRFYKGEGSSLLLLHNEWKWGTVL